LHNSNDRERALPRHDMHVLIIPSWYSADSHGARGVFFREQAQALARAGCRVGVVYPDLKSLRRWREILHDPRGYTEVDEDGVTTHRYHGITWFASRLRTLHGTRWVRRGKRLYRRYVKTHGQPDIIHAHGLIHAGWLARELSRIYGLPYVVTEHSTKYETGAFSDSQLYIAKLAALSAARTFAVSESFCEVLDSKCTHGEVEWVYLPNMVHHGFFETPLGKSLEDSRAPFVFLHLSNLSPNKDREVFTRAFATAFKDDRSVQLRVGGGVYDVRGYESLIRELGIQDQTRLLGPLSRDEVIEEMRGCDAFVMSSRRETFSLVLAEAMSLGKPVIATRCVGPTSIVRPEDGVLVPVGDVDEMATAMRRLRDDMETYDAEGIRKACCERFSEGVVCSRLIAIYREITSSRDASPTDVV